MDLFDPSSGEQVHDFNADIADSGLFWTIAIPDGALTVSDTLYFQLSLIRPALLLPREIVRLSRFELLALTTLFLLDLMFLSFVDKPCF